MINLRPLLLCSGLLAPVAAFAGGAFATGHYPDLFHDWLGQPDAAVAAKLQSAWQQLFAGDENSQRLFYPVPGDMAYVPDIANNDVRTEGMSYGMMICVQTDHRKEFDQLWRFAKHYLWHADGPLRGYFTWHVAFDGGKLRDVGPAPDGEEWFVMALFFASHRWGDRDGIFDYGAEAQALLHTMLHKHEDPDRGPVTDMFDRDAKQVVFVPHPPGATFSDPSYHLPAFYELWARWAAAPEDRAFLAEVARTSRDVFQRAANPRTGLMPDYANFDGTPHVSPWGGHSEFRYDAWRTLAYPALDWSWWAADPREVAQSNRVLRFLAAQGPNCPDRFKLDGTPISTDVNSPGLVAMAAVAALAADRELGQPFVQRLWDLKIPTGHHRYYDGLLTLLALLEVSGNFRIYAPPPAG